jgi:Fur family peroxide stress response transcriptional regulator
MKRTPQRLAVLAYLDGNTSHPSAEDIYRALSKKNPTLSFATVYNTLNALTKAGTIGELAIDPERRRFDPNTTPHHHLICIQCKRIIDIMKDITVELPADSAKGFSVSGSHVEFYGYCARCGNRRKPQ